MQEHDRRLVVGALRGAIPYLRLYNGRVFVIKAGGEAFETDAGTDSLVEQIGVLHQVGISVILVHGGGPQLTRLSNRLGIETRIIGGRRVTSEATREAATLGFNGEVNTRILAAGRRLTVPMIGISGLDAGLIRAKRRDPVEQEDGTLVDYGLVGDILAVKAGVLRKLLDDRFVPVVSPLCADDDGQVLNVNADTVAAQLALALGAEKLILSTGTQGILEDRDDPTSLVSYTDIAGLEQLRKEGKLKDGMLPKVAAISGALAGGVPRVHVVSYRNPDGLLLEVFTNEGSGTLVVKEVSQLSAAELAVEPQGAPA